MRLRKILAAWVVAIAAGGCVTAELKLNLEKGWVLKAGDEAAWADPEFDDGDWTPVEVGVPWEKAGFPDLDGYAWYRVRVVIPARWEESRAVRDEVKYERMLNFGQALPSIRKEVDRVGGFMIRCSVPPTCVNRASEAPQVAASD